MMALSGVRSSWDMLARNSLFIRLASRRRGFSFCSSAASRRTWSSRRRSWMSSTKVR